MSTPELVGEQRRFRQEIRAMWTAGLDTTDMARALSVPEHECERALHVVLAARRAVVGNLGAAS